MNASLYGSLHHVINMSNVTESPSDLSMSDSLSTAEKNLISYYLMGVTTMCICCFGAIGNILSLLVLIKRPIGSQTTNMYLISMAIADLLVLFATILTAIKDSRKPVKDQLTMLIWQDAPFIPRAYPYFHSTAILFQVASVWLTVAFTADRYLMICHPFLAKRWCTVRLAKYIIVVIYCASVCYGIPRYFEYEPFELHIPTNMPSTEDLNQLSNVSTRHTQFQSIVWYDLSEFGSSVQFMRIYHLWSWNILVVALPFINIAVMNSFLICEVRHSNARNAKQNQNPPLNRRHDTDIMLIGVIVVFFICQTPAAISHFSWGLIPLEDTKKTSWYLLNEIGNLLIVVNSAINVIPYYVFSRRFRRHFSQLFCPYRIVRDNGWHCVYVPRWVAEQCAQDASDQAGSTLDGTNHVGFNARLTMYHRHQSCMQSITPSTADQFGFAANRRSSSRLDQPWNRRNSRPSQQSRQHSLQVTSRANNRRIDPGSIELLSRPRSERKYTIAMINSDTNNHTLMNTSLNSVSHDICQQ